MANTFTQIYLHIVFAVQGRVSVIRRNWKDDIEKYITGIVQNRGHKLITINSQPDHLHMLIGLNPDHAPSTLMRDVKSGSSKHINEMRWVNGRFSWQEGYGAFSCGRSMLPDVIHYIENQAEHHSKRRFRQEFCGLLNKYDVTYDEAYIFDEVDSDIVEEASAEFRGRS